MVLGVGVIQIWGLHLNLGDREVLRGVNLCLQPGVIYGLLGPNGAGKSTTLSVITGLRKAHSGSVRVLGMDPARDGRSLRARIGVLPEQAGFYDWMSGRDYLDWSARLYGKRQGQAEALGLLRRVGLDTADPSGIGTYSRGMRQRLALARALINNPELLVLDEPTNGLDPRGRREIHDVLLGLSHKEGIGILLCTHLLDDVDRLCSSVGILAEGQTLLEGSIPDLLGRRRASLCYRILMAPGPHTILLPPGINVVTRIEDWWHIELAADLMPAEAWLRLMEAGFRILEIHREGGGLEELYLAATAPMQEAI